MKLAIKRSLVDDFVAIVLIENFCKNFSFSQTNEVTIKNIHSSSKSLKKIYNEILEMLKLKDASFLVLEKQLSENNAMYVQLEKNKFKNLKEICEYCSNSLDKINCNLKEKLTKLKINSALILNNLQI